MSCQIAVAHEAGYPQYTWCWMYCSTTGHAFGPSFDSEAEAAEFIAYCPGDPRHFLDEELGALHCVWLYARGQLGDHLKPHVNEFVAKVFQIRERCSGDNCRLKSHTS